MRRLPLGDPRSYFGVVLGKLAQLSQHVLLGGAGGFGDEWGGAEELPVRIASPLDLQDASHLAVVGHVERDEHDHPAQDVQRVARKYLVPENRTVALTYRPAEGAPSEK